MDAVKIHWMFENTDPTRDPVGIAGGDRRDESGGLGDAVEGGQLVVRVISGRGSVRPERSVSGRWADLQRPGTGGDIATGPVQLPAWLSRARSLAVLGVAVPPSLCTIQLGRMPSTQTPCIGYSTILGDANIEEADDLVDVPANTLSTPHFPSILLESKDAVDVQGTGNATVAVNSRESSPLHVVVLMVGRVGSCVMENKGNRLSTEGMGPHQLSQYSPASRTAHRRRASLTKVAGWIHGQKRGLDDATITDLAAQGVLVSVNRHLYTSRILTCHIAATTAELSLRALAPSLGACTRDSRRRRQSRWTVTHSGYALSALEVRRLDMGPMWAWCWWVHLGISLHASRISHLPDRLREGERNDDWGTERGVSSGEERTIETPAAGLVPTPLRHLAVLLREGVHGVGACTFLYPYRGVLVNRRHIYVLHRRIQRVTTEREHSWRLCTRRSERLERFLHSHCTESAECPSTYTDCQGIRMPPPVQARLCIRNVLQVQGLQWHTHLCTRSSVRVQGLRRSGVTPPPMDMPMLIHAHTLRCKVIDGGCMPSVEQVRSCTRASTDGVWAALYDVEVSALRWPDGPHARRNIACTICANSLCTPSETLHEHYTASAEVGGHAYDGAQTRVHRRRSPHISSDGIPLRRKLRCPEGKRELRRPRKGVCLPHVYLRTRTVLRMPSEGIGGLRGRQTRGWNRCITYRLAPDGSCGPASDRPAPCPPRDCDDKGWSGLSSHTAQTFQAVRERVAITRSGFHIYGALVDLIPHFTPTSVAFPHPVSVRLVFVSSPVLCAPLSQKGKYSVDEFQVRFGCQGVGDGAVDDIIARSRCVAIGASVLRQG
ncbi:hypothetical protein DFP72DRAFT_863216 [Ephemerocybe angulata]|uniref:Uncharacterized protein n=1 Tax=Ephemerocybe angulata TaxID=980116 RepID=A0A8H6H7P6_9AGAR|nr:hypothetical protein DFP72DRAFT_863216 [Tulosesus angulatus]